MFYANLRKVNMDRHPGAVVVLGTIEDATKFSGKQDGYNGMPGVLLKLRCVDSYADFPLAGRSYVGRFLKDVGVDNVAELVGERVEILGEGRTVTSETDVKYRFLRDYVYGIKPFRVRGQKRAR
jgi:hypothetical protein